MERLHGVAAAEREVARIEQKPDVGRVQELLDLGRRLHERGRVVVERRLVASRARQLGRTLDTLHQARPARLVERRSTPGIRAPLRRPRIGKDRPRARAVGRVEEIQRRGHRGQVHVPVLGLAEAHRDVSAGEGESETREPLAQVRPVAEIARRPELRPHVAGVGRRREHLLRARNVREDADRDLERAVAARRVRDPDGGQRVTIGTRGSFAILVQAPRIQASAGSSAAAIDRRSPASAFR